MEPSTVQAIQVASALIERMGVLMQQGTGLDQIINRSDVPGTELRLGEAQQTMPEIWDHLGRARDQLASAGHDVSRYDHVRAGVDVGLANTQIDVGHHGRHKTKTVTFDQDVLHRAIAARDVLRQLCTDVDWYGLERAQALELAKVGSLTRGNWLPSQKTVVVTMMVLVIAAWFWLKVL